MRSAGLTSEPDIPMPRAQELSKPSSPAKMAAKSDWFRCLCRASEARPKQPAAVSIGDQVEVLDRDVRRDRV